MPERHDVLALICYLAIPVVVTAGAAAHRLIDPELARGRADYEQTYRLLDHMRLGALAAAAVLALVLWTSCCYLLLRSRRRSLRWLALAAAGPFGLIVIASLADRAPAAGDRYQQFVGRLTTSWRVAFELAVLVAVWVGSYQTVMLRREAMIRLESFTTGTPIATIVAQQTASSGMWAAGEGMEELYLVGLLYLLRPIAFNLAGRLRGPR